MKTVSILFADDHSLHLTDAIFDGKSAFDRSLRWAAEIHDSAGIFVFTGGRTALLCRKAAETAGISCTFIEKESWTARNLLSEIAASCRKEGALSAVYAYADCPFLNDALTRELIETQEKYRAEYTFADGYPYGLAPEIIDGGTAAILAGLCDGNAKTEGEKHVARDTLFAVLKTDINSFEIETVLAPEDWRLYRFEFACGTKAGLVSCRELFADGVENKTPAELSSAAVKNVRILRTVPGFYTVQIDERCPGTCTYCPYPASYRNIHGGKSPADGSCMDYDRFAGLVKQMAALSENAVVALSAWGEPLRHPDFVKCVAAVLAEPGLSVLVETDGLLVTEELCAAVKAVAAASPERTNGNSRIMWIVSLDAVTEQTYAALRGNAGTLAQGMVAVSMLAQQFPGDVYPQMVRMEKNEAELEKFYRFWKEPNAPAGGKFIIQKYDNFCGQMPDCKPADLSPIGRNPCWHLRRDMTILADGSVPMCHEITDGSIVGNVFSGQLADIWNNMTLQETEKCRKCDEYYTYNF